MNETVFFINQHMQIEQRNYRELVEEYSFKFEGKLSLHVSEVEWSKVEDKLYRLEWAIETDPEWWGKERPETEKFYRFEVLRWEWDQRYQQPYEKLVEVFDTKEDAEMHLFKCMEEEFYDGTAMRHYVFNTLEEANAGLTRLNDAIRRTLGKD